MKDSKKVHLFGKTAFLLISLASAVILLSSFAFAAEEITGAMVKDLLLKVINFSILIFILVYFVKKPLKDFLSNRRTKIETELKDASLALKKAEKEYKDAEEHLNKLSDEIKNITLEIRSQGEAEKEKIVLRAEELAHKIKEHTDQAVKREFELIQRQIKTETIEQTINTAEAALKGQFKPEDQSRVAEHIASEISKVKDVGVFLQNPISANLKKKVPLDIDKSKSVTAITMDFIKILVAADGETRKNLGDIRKAFDNYVNEITSTSKAQIYSATDISESALTHITSSLKKAVGRDIEVEVIKDPSLVGGIVAKIGSLVFDASIRTQLEGMRENLKKEVV